MRASDRAGGGGGEGAGFPAWAGPAERLRFLLRYAILAPSRYNAQPWAFEIEGPELRVYADAHRALRAADRQGRELVMACAAAVHNVEVAARRFGHASSLEPLPPGRKDGLLARLTLEERRPPTPHDEQLFAAISSRRTNRFGFEPRDAPPGLVAALARTAAEGGATLRMVDPNVRPAVAQLVAEGARAQWRSARFRAELAAWSRSSGPGEVDGMPGFAHGRSDAALVVHRLLMRLLSRAAAEERRDRHYALHSRALLALCTRGDGPSDWFGAGRILQQVLLLAAARGLCASYFSQAIEVAPVRARLREALGERGWPQVLFRLGHGREQRPTPRRPVEAVLRSSASAQGPRALARIADGPPSSR